MSHVEANEEVECEGCGETKLVSEMSGVMEMWICNDCENGIKDTMPNPLSLEAWEEKYTPVDVNNAGYETCMEYDEAMALAKGFNSENPQFHVWTRVDGDNGKLILCNGFRICNRLDYCVTEKPWGDNPKGSDYIEVSWED